MTFTPPICIFAKKAKISPLPYLIGEFISANTWSMMLVVGNPTNIYLATSCGVTFIKYFTVMVLPTFVAGLTALGVLIAIFNHAFNKPLPIETALDYKEKTVTVDKVRMYVSLGVLFTCIILLAIADVIMVEMYLICLSAFILLTLFNLVYGLITERSCKNILGALKKGPYELIPFLLSMFVLVLALDQSGFINVLKNAFITGNKTDTVTFGFLSGLSANLLNNIPMSVLFEKIVNGGSAGIILGAIIGSNIGAFITPVGALAGIMWNKILRDYGVKLSFGKFSLLGTIIAVPTLFLSCLTLMLIA